MSKLITSLLLCIMSIATFAQIDSLRVAEIQKKVKTMEVSVCSLEQEVVILKCQLQKQTDSLNSLRTMQRQQTSNVRTLADKVGTDIITTNTKIDDNIATLSHSISAKSIWAICGISLSIVLLLVFYFVLRKNIRNDASTISKIKTAQKAMQEESLKLDEKLVELLEKQVATQPQTISDNQLDHSLALKVADEIVRIETNLSHMDQSVKGYKQLNRAVERIRTNFLANGYEIVEMLGKSYSEGMKASVSFETDESLAYGEQRITGIIKPQINYKGKMIQPAQIKVSQNI